MSKLDSQDIEAIKGLIEVTIHEKLDEKLDEKLKYLPTKDEFYEKVDDVMGELKAIREEKSVQSHQFSNHEDRLGKTESLLWMTS